MMSGKLLDLDPSFKQIEPSLKKRFERILEHKQFVDGPEARDLETKLTEYVRPPADCVSVSGQAGKSRFAPRPSQALAVNSGTAALTLCLSAAGVRAGDEVVTSPFSFGATALVVLQAGAVPVFAGFEEETGLLSAGSVSAALSKKTKALLPVSLYGQTCDMDALNQKAQDCGLIVIEDACQSFGASFKRRKSAALSALAAVSFYPSKPLGGCGNAGAVFTNDDRFLETLKKLRNHGQSDRFIHEEPSGINARINSFQAACVLSKLEIFEQELAMRRQKAALYDEAFKEQDDVFPLKIHSGRESARSYYVLRSARRDRIRKFFAGKGMDLPVHYPLPLFDQPAVKGRCRFPPLKELARARRFAKEIFSLPLHAYMKEAEQTRIIDTLKKALSS